MNDITRHLIEGELELLTPLHLGSGEATERPGLVAERAEGRAAGGPKKAESVEVSAVVVDHQGSAYLPGRALKGALRAWLASVPALAGSSLVAQVLGSEEIAKKEERQGATAYGGKAELWNALRTPAPGNIQNLPFWCPQRCTAVRASVALDRRTRTVAGDRLFHQEFVPPCTKFSLKVSAQGLSDEELDLLLFALDGFNYLDRPVTLGAGNADGHGRFTWTLGQISRLGRGDVAPWLTKKTVGYEGLFPLAADEQARIKERARKRWTRPSPAAGLEARLAITFDAPFLVAAPHRKKEGAEGEPDHVPVTDIDGRPLLPASSLRGALRHRAEKILRTLGVHACRPEDPEEACKPVTTKAGVAGLCAACRLFGAPGWGSLLAVSDFTEVGEKSDARQFEHVAIDRFTGGVSGSLKFNTKAFVGPKLEGRIRLDRERLPEVWMPGLLALVVRDLVEGDLPLGFGSAKGYGACHAEILDVAGDGHVWSQAAEVTPEQRAALEKQVKAFQDWVPRQARRTPEPAAKAVPLPEVPHPPAEPKPVTRPSPDGEFHNPYHFIPAEPRMADPEEISRADFAAGRLGALRHDHFLGEGFYSGRLVFRVKTERPTVIGGERIPGDDTRLAEVKPFELNGEPALPGATLRGLISNIAEAATGSAMRILHDHSLSFRAKMHESLPALGLLVEEGGMLKLEPLALPNLYCNAAGHVQAAAVGVWRKLFPQPLVRVYVDGFQKASKRGVEIRKGSFLDSRRLRSASSDNRGEYWYLKLGAGLDWNSDGSLSIPNAHIKAPKDGGQAYQVVAQDLPGKARAWPICQAQYDSLASADRENYVRGLLRILDFEKHENQIPTQRKHELFLPLPVSGPARPKLNVERALLNFERMADERTEADDALPFGLKGKLREPEQKKKRLIRLKAGDLVYFRVTENDPFVVAELALSSIWRRRTSTVFEFLNPELHPFNSNRQRISPADRLFGFVEHLAKDEQNPKGTLAIAGRVRFAFGRLESNAKDWYLREHPEPLAILGSPKPPAPAFYFKHKNRSEALIAKSGLRPSLHTLQGRKVYLHTRAESWKYQGPEGDRIKLRCKAKPLRPGLAFLAHLDFDNLTERELASLVYALRPTAAFRHLIGMGKPLGLGRVEIARLGLFLVNRSQRYGGDGDLLTSPRYHQVSLPEPLAGSVAARYGAEAAAQGAKAGPAFDDLVGRFRAAMQPAIRQALELVGDPAAVTAEVHYPRMSPEPDPAQEGFQWFVDNEKFKEFVGQQLTPIENALPTLERVHRKQGPLNSGHGGGGHKVSSGGWGGKPTNPPPDPTPTAPGKMGGLFDKLKVLKKD